MKKSIDKSQRVCYNGRK